MNVRERIGTFVESDPVQRVITGLIIFNAVTLGMETSPALVETMGGFLRAADTVVLTVFVLEIAGKLLYRGFGFFRNGWNVFDFVIVGIALMPAAGDLKVLRALRILRTLRLLSVVPQMRRVIQALLMAIPGIMSVALLILLLFYVGAVLSTNLYGPDFPEWFGSIGASMYTLFQVMTLESWSMGIVRPVMDKHPTAWIFFVPFILVTSFAVLNLFIGIIVDAMQAQGSEEEERLHRDAEEILDETESVKAELAAVRGELVEMRRLLESRGGERKS